MTLDFDSSVIYVNGSQEGADKGFNPKSIWQKSYHPLLCFIAQTKECLHSWFRSGSAYAGNGAPEFIKECFSTRTKRAWKVFVRADSGFFNGALLDVLFDTKSEYLIKVKMMNLASLLMQQNWKKVKAQKGVESTEFVYQCNTWKKGRRLVAIRKEIDLALDPKTLFPIPSLRIFLLCDKFENQCLENS